MYDRDNTLLSPRKFQKNDGPKDDTLRRTELKEPGKEEHEDLQVGHLRNTRTIVWPTGRENLHDSRSTKDKFIDNVTGELKLVKRVETIRSGDHEGEGVTV